MTTVNFDAFPALGAYCERVLNNPSLHRQLERENFDIALVDIAFNECNLALTHYLSTLMHFELIIISIKFKIILALVSAIVQ